MNRRWEWLERVSQWPGWRLLGALAVAFVVGVVFYIGVTVRDHNSDLTQVADQNTQLKAQVTCMKQGFDQVLNELLHNATITAPPDC